MSTTRRDQELPPRNPFLMSGPSQEAGNRWRFQTLPRFTPTQPLFFAVVGTGMAVISAHIVVNYPPREAVALFTALLGGVLVFLRPFVGIMAYFVLAFLRPQDVFWGLDSVRLTYLASLATLGAFGIHLMFRPRLDFLRRWETLFLCVLWLSLWLSIHFGRFGEEQQRWMSYYNKIFLVYFLVIALTVSLRQLNWLSWIIALSVGYLGYWANDRYFNQGFWVIKGPGVTLDDENDFAMFLAMSLPFMWYSARSAKNLVIKAGFLLCMVLAGHGVMLTYSRGGFLGMAAAMAWVALREKRRWLQIAMIAGGVGFYATTAGDNYQERIGSIDDYEEDGSATGRLVSWKTGGRMLADNPWFGVGLKQYVYAYPYYAASPVEFPREAHNSWVQLAGECGSFAVAGYGLLIVASLLSFRRVEKRLPRLPDGKRKLARSLNLTYQSTMIAYLVCGFFLSMEDQEFFYLLVALVQILDRVTAKDVAAAEAEAETPAHPPPAPAPAA
ncbi:MAG TPA: O-antigen ligase family protein [bacterium]|nr:O-antigen ligase family protein [bacterium]